MLRNMLIRAGDTFGEVLDLYNAPFTKTVEK